MRALTAWFRQPIVHRKPWPNGYDAPISVAIPVQNADTLLAPSYRQETIHRIEELTRLPSQHHAALVQVAIENYAAFVQQLPASEAHHHAGRGGMLDHGLEVLRQALLVRRGRLLPIGGAPEQVAQQHDIWTYAVAMAALLHDLGKPAVDQKITLYRGNGQRLGIWDPWAGPMTRVGHCHGYTLDYCRNRQYRSHERAAPLLVHHILPSRGLSWIASEPQVFAQWLATISGNMDEAGALGEIIQEADGISVARNLGANAPRAAMTKTKALWERLLTGLRHLILEGELPLNRNGAAGWLVGDDLWLVSKRAIDALRAHLVAEGHSGIPSSNDRIYDTFQEHGILTPCNDRAIWRATVSGEGWSHELTLIRLPAQRIWPQAADRPDTFAGQIQPAEASASSVGEAAPDIPGTVSPAGAATETGSAHDANSEEDALPLPDLAGDQANPLDASEQQSGLATDDVEVQPSTPESPSTKMSGETGHSDPGRQFLSWLQQQAAQNQLSVNTPTARLHVVEEGLLLVSPAVFKDYASLKNGDDEWGHIQKRFLKMKLNQKLSDGTNVHRYVVSGERSTSHVKGILLPDPSIIWGSHQRVPQVNQHLRAANK